MERRQQIIVVLLVLAIVFSAFSLFVGFSSFFNLDDISLSSPNGGDASGAKTSGEISFSIESGSDG